MSNVKDDSGSVDGSAHATEQPAAARRWAEWYLKTGYVPLPVAHGTKEAMGKGWQFETLDSVRAKIDSMFPKRALLNVGILLGEASNHVADVDLDCSETVLLAGEFLPKTRVFGRKSKPASHWLFKSEGAKTKKFVDPELVDGDAKAVLVEIRANSSRGKGGAQTVFPPSVHPSGEVIAFVDPMPDLTTMAKEDLERAVSLLAATALLARHWPGEGARHDASLACAGMLLGIGCSPNEVVRVVLGIAIATDDEEFEDREAAARSTIEKFEDGDDVLTGAPTLVGLGVPESVVGRVRAWIGRIADASAEAIFDQSDGLNPVTDSGNGRRFAVQHRHATRYVVEWRKWVSWNETHWADDPMRVSQLALMTAKAIYSEAKAVELGGNRDFAKLLRQHAKASQAVPALEKILTAAQSIPGMYVSAKDLDKDNWLLACPNGTLDLRTGILRPARCEDMLTHLCPTPYHPTAQAPLWRKTIREMMGGDDALVDFLQMAVGYTLTGCVQEECILLLYGVGQNGKSLLLRTLQHVFGDEHSCTVPSDVLLTKQGYQGHPTGLTIMHGKRLAVTLEPDMNRKLAEGLVKSITGGDRISARRMNENFWEYLPRHTIWLATNHKPIIRGTDLGIWRRILPIPFNVVFTNPDKRLGEKLKAEAQGILAWAVEGALAYIRHPERFVLPAKADEFKRQYQAEQDRLGEFIDDCVERVPGHRERPEDIWRRYTGWCLSQQEEPIAKHTFWTMLDERGFPVGPKVNGIRGRLNIRLRHR